MAERILITGISGNLGQRLAPLLASHRLVGLDLHQPRSLPVGAEFVHSDLGKPGAETALENLLRQREISVVYHLAFVIDPVRTGVIRSDRLWQANVGGTQRLLEAIARVNQSETRVCLFVFPSSVSVYGPDYPTPADESAPLAAHTLPYAIHKQETDEICRAMYPRLNGCAVEILRPAVYAGGSMDNFILRALRGQPSGRGPLARLFHRANWKVPVILPAGDAYIKWFQYVHVDDVSRLMAWLLDHYRPRELRILNVAGHGDPVSIPEALLLSRVPLWRPRSYRLVQFVYWIAWSLGFSGVPPNVLPYFVGSYLMNTDRLRTILGPEYSKVIQYSCREAVEDSLRENTPRFDAAAR